MQNTNIGLFQAAWSAFTLFFKAYPRRFVLVSGLMFLSGLLEGLSFLSFIPVLELLGTQDLNATSAFTQKLVSSITLTGLPPTLGSVMAVIVCLMIMRSILLAFGSTYIQRSFTDYVAMLRNRLIASTMQTSWSRIRSLQPGALLNSILNETDLASATAQQMTLAKIALIQGGAYLITAFLISWQFTVVSLTGAMVMMVLLSFLIKTSRAESMKRTDVTRRYSALITDWLQNQKPLKVMGLNSDISSYLEKITVQLRDSTNRLSAIQSFLTVGQEILIVMFLALIILLSHNWLKIEMASLLVGIVLLQRIMTRFSSFQTSINSIARHQSGFLAVSDRLNWLEEQKEIHFVNSQDHLPKIRLENDITYQDVSFAYSNTPVLSRISFEIKRGTMTALIGPSGSGKSTLLDMLSGLIIPHSGAVRIDDLPLQSYNIPEWRKKIGYVPQDVILLHDTIRNNLSLGNPDISDADMFKALDLAEAGDFVRGRPEGLETWIGERGQDLSGGQRQRLALARALIHNPKLLILDEATSALDQETEIAVANTLRNLTPELTIILTSHRPVFERIADQVIYVENGHIRHSISSGIPFHLLANNESAA